MKSREEEYIEMFRAEAHENYEDLNRLFTELENDLNNQSIVDSIFRITHTLKGNAMGLGLERIAELGHVLEDVFGAVKNKQLVLDATLFNYLYKANDKLGALIAAIGTDEKVSYKGIATKIKVALRKLKEAEQKVQEPAKEEIQQEEKEPKVEVVAKEPEESVVETSGISFSDYINVSVEKLDNLLNITGELIVEKDSLISRASEGGLSVDYSRLHRIISDLQYGIMGVRLVPLGFMFNKFQRVVRDVAVLESKEIELSLEGTEIEIDRNILKIISDSLVHLIRNSISHGIESAEERQQSGKPSKGNVKLSASNEKESVIIKVIDDGKGINSEVIAEKAVSKGLITREEVEKLSVNEQLELIFLPGFSNAETITEVSGRGVGMDVVKRAVESIGGSVQIDTTVGEGTEMQLVLPVSLALKAALLFEVGANSYAIPLTYIESVIAIKKDQLRKLNDGVIYNHMGQTIFLTFLNDTFYPQSQQSANEHLKKIDENEKLNVIIISYENKMIGFVVDNLLQQKEIVEKILSPPLDNISLFSGASILGDGSVCLVINVPGILKESLTEKTKKNDT